MLNGSDSLGTLPCHAIAVSDGGSSSLSGIVTSKRDDDGLGYEVRWRLEVFLEK